MLKAFFKSDFQTKLFYLNWGIYGLALILTTVYCYGRLDFVRSGQQAAKTTTGALPTLK